MSGTNFRNFKARAGILMILSIILAIMFVLYRVLIIGYIGNNYLFPYNWQHSIAETSRYSSANPSDSSVMSIVRLQKEIKYESRSLRSGSGATEKRSEEALDEYIMGFENRSSALVQQLLNRFKSTNSADSSILRSECDWSNLQATCSKSPLYLAHFDSNISEFMKVGESTGNIQISKYELQLRNCTTAKKMLVELADVPFADLVDLVIIVSHTLNFELLLKNWEDDLRMYHSIFLIDDTVEDSSMFITEGSVPLWLSYEVHTAESLRKRLGHNGWVVGSKEGGLGDGESMISFGGWISHKEYIYVITSHEKQTTINSNSCFSAIENHLFNLLTPIIDDFDGCQEKSEHQKRINFIRKTIMSLTASQYRPNSLSPETTFPVPLGLEFLYEKPYISMYSPRLLSNALLIFKPMSNRLYGGENFSDYTQLSEFTSTWMIKTYLDWIRGGVKMVAQSSSLPSSALSSTTTSSSRVDLVSDREHSESFESSTSLQRPLIHVFDRKRSLYSPQLSTNNKRHFIDSWKNMNNETQNLLATIYVRILNFNMSRVQKLKKNNQCTRNTQDVPLTCYITEFNKHLFGRIIDTNKYIKYMQKLTQSYYEIWASRRLFNNKLLPVAVKSSYKPRSSHSCAMITISHNEAQLFPIWLRYYSRHFDYRDIFVFDHLTTDGSLNSLPKGVNLFKFNVKFAMPVHERSETIRFYQDFLLRQGYKCVVFGDVDEIIAPNPAVYPGGLKEYLERFVGNESLQVVRVKAFDLGHMSFGDNGDRATTEAPINWNESILSQRSFYIDNPLYEKALVSKVPLYYRPGFHKLYDSYLQRETNVDENLVMFHLNSIDKEWCQAKLTYKEQLMAKMKSSDLNTGYAKHWKVPESDKAQGLMCRYAIACMREVKSNEDAEGAFEVKVNSTTKKYFAFDNLAHIRMKKLPDIWCNVVV